MKCKVVYFFRTGTEEQESELGNALETINSILEPSRQTVNEQTNPDIDDSSSSRAESRQGERVAADMERNNILSAAKLIIHTKIFLWFGPNREGGSGVRSCAQAHFLECLR